MSVPVSEAMLNHRALETAGQPDTPVRPRHIIEAHVLTRLDWPKILKCIAGDLGETEDLAGANG